MTDTLFPDLEPTVVAPVEDLSADRRRTLRQKANAAAGIHPLTKERTDSDHTCGTCVHRVLLTHHDRTYPKCYRDGPRGPLVASSAATDVRAWWPACPRWALR